MLVAPKLTGWSGLALLALLALGIGTRLWWSCVCALRVLIDPAFAARTWAVRSGTPEPELRQPAEADAPPANKADADEQDAGEPPDAATDRSALVLLALLQREGRLVDFLEQDIADFDDEDIGAAARAVHEGCRKALRSHATVEPVRDEAEESRVTIEAGYAPSDVKLTGAVGPKPPYAGVLRHRGWRVRELSLPEPVAGHDVQVVAPAEVEL
jgi:hypothetical protein